jgi:DNA helicase-2/ATP-dependent DNA helicase PcrA
VAAQILRRHAELVGLKSSYTILDTDDQERLLKQLLEAENIDAKRWTPRAGRADRPPGRIAAGRPTACRPPRPASSPTGKGQALYRQYQERLRILNACDFGDLLLHNLTIFTANPDVLADFQRRFQYVLVDEYQDTNVAQYLWLRLLAQKPPERLLRGRRRPVDLWLARRRGRQHPALRARLPGRQGRQAGAQLPLDQHILAAASGLIAANKSRLGKTLWTEAAGGEKVKVRGVWDGEAESRLIADEIEKAKRAGRKYSDMAILVRASFQMRAFEERFVMLQIPYKVVGGPRFFERAEIRDAHAYLRLIQSPDDDLAFERIVNTPKRGIGDTSVQKLLQIARLDGISARSTRRG